MRRSLGVVVVLMFVFASSAVARGGPPVPDGCTFEGGRTTCTTLGENYGPVDMVINTGATYCKGSGLYEVTIGSVTVTRARDRVTTVYRGRSHVVESESVVVVGTGFAFIGNYSEVWVGPC